MLPHYTYVDTDTALSSLVGQLSSEPLLAIDTESNSLHAYRERVCLIQISTRSADYIIDPLTIGDLSALGMLFAESSIEKVFHAAEYDLMCLKRDYGFRFESLFDTMIAARICGIKQVGLGNLLADLSGIKVDKSHQRDDWGQRPLPDASLYYAQMDTHYLPDLRDSLRERLSLMGRLEEAEETFRELCHTRPGSSGFDPDGYWRIAHPHRLNNREATCLRELYLWRERIAENRDLPPFKVLGDKTLVALAIDQPRTLEELARADGIGSNVRRYGHELLRLIERGRTLPAVSPPPPEPPADPLVVEIYTALRDWRKARAAEREVESDVIVARETLWTLAVRQPRSLDEMRGIHGLGPWRLATYGQELLAVLRRF